jgi:hypothetical protein
MTKKNISSLNLRNFLMIFSLIISLCSCQNFLGAKNVNNIDNSIVSDPSKVVVSTYLNGEVTLKNVNVELEKLIMQNNKLKGITFDKLSSDQKEAIIKEVVLKEMAYLFYFLLPEILNTIVLIVFWKFVIMKKADPFLGMT